ncbi:MAG TPA: hypothetical protein VGM39_12670 [Kofleriaceae bacterium]|jgi:uncharacterized protein YdbL (DUF1318 family)
MRGFASCSIVVAVLAAAAGVAAAPKVVTPSRKPADPDMTPTQLQHMAAAVVLDKAGELGNAVREYEAVLKEDQPAPSIYWNMADIERRREDYRQALKDLVEYQKHVTTEKEKAAAQKLMDAIAATPYRLAITGIDTYPTAVYIDGVHVGTGPMVLDLPDGPHTLDMITSERYLQRDITAKKMGTDYTAIPRPPLPASERGNVIISGSPEWNSSMSWRDDHYKDKGEDKMFWLPGRITLPPGHYETEIGGRDRSERRACSPLVFDVPRDGIIFLYLKAEPREDPRACQNFNVVTQKVVTP